MVTLHDTKPAATTRRRARHTFSDSKNATFSAVFEDQYVVPPACTRPSCVTTRRAQRYYRYGTSVRHSHRGRGSSAGDADAPTRLQYRTCCRIERSAVSRRSQQQSGRGRDSSATQSTTGHDARTCSKHHRSDSPEHVELDVVLLQVGHRRCNLAGAVAAGGAWEHVHICGNGAQPPRALLSGRDPRHRVSRSTTMHDVHTNRRGPGRRSARWRRSRRRSCRPRRSCGSSGCSRR